MLVLTPVWLYCPCSKLDRNWNKENLKEKHTHKKSILKASLGSPKNDSIQNTHWLDRKKEEEKKTTSGTESQFQAHHSSKVLYFVTLFHFSDELSLYWRTTSIPLFTTRAWSCCFFPPGFFVLFLRCINHPKLLFAHVIPDVILCGWLGSKHQVTKIAHVGWQCACSLTLLN